MSWFNLYFVVATAGSVLCFMWLAWRRSSYDEGPPAGFVPQLLFVALLAGIVGTFFTLRHWSAQPLEVVAFLYLVLLGAAAARARKPITRVRRWASLGFGALSLIVVLISGFLLYALPIPTVPAPRGPYRVGTMTWEFDDTSRKDPYAPTPDQPRKIMLQAWYPAELAAGSAVAPAAWSKDIGVFGPAIANKFHLPPFLFDHLSSVRSNAVEDATVKAATGGWPVVVYSHGWTGFRTIALDEVEALASNGYVVFAPDHIYGAMATVLKDGTAVLNNPKAMPPDEPRDAKRQAGIELLVDTYGGDIRFVLDTIEKMNSGAVNSPFMDRLDLGKIGLFGHSTGGGAIFEVADTDPRVKCAFGLDTWTEPISQDVRDKPIAVPFFSLRSALWAGTHDEKARVLEELLAKAKGPTYNYYVSDTKHADFTLMPILSPFAGILGMTGTIDGRRVLEIGDAYLVAFFDQYLKGKASPLLEAGNHQYAEVKQVSPEAPVRAAAGAVEKK